jgi:hypothetical protein
LQKFCFSFKQTSNTNINCNLLPAAHFAQS